MEVNGVNEKYVYQSSKNNSSIQISKNETDQYDRQIRLWGKIEVNEYCLFFIYPNKGFLFFFKFILF